MKRTIQFILLMAIVLGMREVSASALTTIFVDNNVACNGAGQPHCTLQDALDFIDSQPDWDTYDKIEIAAGTYIGATVWPTNTIDDFTIEGAGEDVTILDGNAEGSVIEVRAGVNLTISAVTLQNGSASSGGGLNVREGGVTATNVTFQNNSASIFGGGAYVFSRGQPSVLSDVTFSNNEAEIGGGLRVVEWSGVANTVSIENALFSGNNAIGIGGALYTFDIDVTISNSIFEDSIAVNNGGCFYLADSSTTIDTSTLQNCTSGDDGGGIYQDGEDPLTILNSQLIDNIAGVSGGAVFVADGADVDISGTLIQGNQALISSGTRGGGGIAIDDADLAVVTRLTLHNSQVLSNTTTADGGGIWVQYPDATEVVVEDSTIAFNQADGAGGGIYTLGDLDIDVAEIHHNTSDGNGGGLFVGDTAFINEAYIHSNQSLSADGGGLYSHGFTWIEASTFHNNIAVGQGGGIYSAMRFDLYNSTVSLNQAAEGAGLYHHFSLARLNNVTIAYNDASGPGGGIRFAGGGGRFEIGNTIVAHNTASIGADCRALPITGAIESQGATLVRNGGGCTITPATGDQIGTLSDPIEPLLTGFSNYGGPTPLYGIMTDSPAVDTGDNVPCMPVDQRGQIRPVGGICDIGAFENDGTNPVPTTITLRGLSLNQTHPPLLIVAIVLTTMTIFGLPFVERR